MRLSPENQQWLDNFRARHGRAPRILHVGNIANNAYNNARLLNEAGLDCDVICYDYYHVMACPEWEDSEVSGHYGDQFRPKWSDAGFGDFRRPPWFAQGPLKICVDYLISKREGRNGATVVAWRRLAIANGTENGPRNRLWISPAIVNSVSRVQSAMHFVLNGRHIAARVAKFCDDKEGVAAFAGHELTRMIASWGFLTLALMVRVAATFVRLPFVWLKKPAHSTFSTRSAALLDCFSRAFPSRPDFLTKNDLEPYRTISVTWWRLFKHYDIVQGYATDPILPMVAGKKPYIGFEHGTLRSHTQCDEPICRLTSLAYHLADHVFITNGDCIEYARKIGVTRFTPMLHPVDERRIDSIGGVDLRGELGVRHVFLCTLRHDWAIKGTDQYIRALPDLVKALGRDFRVIMTRWGAELDRSIALAESLGVGDLIVWSEPLPRRRLIQTLKSVDILFDQLALPHFGATAPEGIAAGVPVIMSYDPRSTEWLVAEPAPILSAHTPAEIVEQVLQALDPVWLADYRPRAAKWFDAHHSSRLVVQGHLDVYRRLIPAH